VDILNAIIMGIVEGITEFLPISSTGHLIIASKLLNYEVLGGTFEIVIQLGAILAVIWYYRQDLTQRAVQISSSAQQRGFWLKLIVAFVPAGIIGFLFGDEIKGALFRPTVVAVSLIVGGVILWLIELRAHRSSITTLDDVPVQTAFWIGVIQVMALIPGVSRAGSSMVGGFLLGLDRPTATKFSFYLALPTLGMATLYDLVRNLGEIASAGRTLEFIVGIFVSFVTALLAIDWLLKYVSRNDFRGFALYRIVVGALILVLVAAGLLPG
jgi:undecaprenyl-diphosphatase